MTGQRDGLLPGGPDAKPSDPERESAGGPERPLGEETWRSPDGVPLGDGRPPLGGIEPPLSERRRRPVALEREFGGGRFELHEHLGAGAMGVVYTAYDRQRDEKVALKTLRHLEPASLSHFKREFRSLASVVHPNLVRLRELFVDADEVFFTMDLVHGVTLSSFLANASSRSGEFRVLRGTFRQLADGLLGLHAHGKIHRDLKPSNVMVRNDGSVVVLDFGVACDADVARRTADGTGVAGTPAYMSPEQVLGESVSVASDWYAFGTMLYEALAGRLPFQGPLLELLRDKTSRIPPPIDEQSGAGELAGLALELLARQPEARPTGAEVRNRLSTRPEPPPNESRRPVASSVGRTEFVGREEQLLALEQALYRVQGGELVTVLVSGVSGIGKTTLVKEFLADDCAAKGVLVLSSKCFEQEFVRYNAVDGVIDGLGVYLRRQSTEVRARLTPRHAGALAAVFPALGDVLARDTPFGERLPVQPGERRRMAFHALRELFGRVSEMTRVVMFLDDLQWGDSDSARLLAVLLGGIDPPPLLVVGACRSDERALSPLLCGLQAEGEGVWKPIEIEISPLRDRESRHLLQRLLGGGSGDVDRIVRDAAGNPFFLLEMALAAKESASAPGGAPLSEVIRSRVRSLPEVARGLLEAVAIGERPLSLRLVESAIAAGREAEAGWLALKHAKLVRSAFSGDEVRIQCYHDRVREAVAGGLGPERARFLHGQLATLLEAGPDPDPEQLAEHFRRAEQPEKARNYARRAGDASRVRLAFGRASRWYSLALELCAEEDEERLGLSVDLAEALENAGHAQQAARHYLRAAEIADDEDAALDLRRRGAGQLLGAGHIEEGLAVLATVLKAVGLGSPRTTGGAIGELLWDRLMLKLRGLAFVERQASEIPRAELLRIDAIAAAAAGYTRSDFLRGAVFACKELRFALRAGETTRVARALASELLFVANEGVAQRERVAGLRAMAEGLFPKVEDDRVLGYLKACCGATHLLLGDAALGTPELGEAEGLLARGRPSWELTITRGLWALTLQIRGGLIDVAEAFAEWLADARERSDLQAERYFAINQSFGFLGLDQADTAYDSLCAALRATEKAGNDFLHFAALHAFVLIASYRHEGPAVFERLAQEHQPFFRSTLRGGQLSRAYVRVYLGYCAVAIAAQTPAARRDLRKVRRIAQALFGEKVAFAQAHAHLLLAAVHRLSGRSHEAYIELTKGAAIFDGLEQRLQAGAARYQLGRLIGGDEGDATVNAALAVARELRIRDPIRMYESYTPGFWP